MIIYLDEAYETKLKEQGRMTPSDLYDAIMHGAVERVRPKMMTVSAIIAGLLPIMWSSETGASVMKPRPSGFAMNMAGKSKHSSR